MKKKGILNSDISKVLSDLGHTDRICIADCGLPVPSNVKKIDLAVTYGLPSFIDVLTHVEDDMEIEKIILAEEIKTINPTLLKDIKHLLKDIEIEFVSHNKLKELTNDCKTVIRTGENKPYANIILQSGVYFGNEA
jgi:D-ribose pyranase